MGLLHRIARRCEVHDRAAPAKIARLEVATGINPNAVAELDTGSVVDDYANPDIVDCGHPWCHTSR